MFRLLLLNLIRRLKKKVLVTGGLGFIGSHTALKLLENNYEIIVLDNLLNSKIEVRSRISQLSKKDFDFVEGDIRDRDLLKNLFKNNKINCVIHFAGLKAAGESEKYPLDYYDNNVVGSLVLLQEMKLANIKSITCYSNEADKWRMSEIVFTKNNEVQIVIKEKFIGERGRINCSLKDSSGFWRWLGIQFVVSEK